MLAQKFADRLYSVAEILALQEAGQISDDDDFELIEGVIVPMGPKHAAHELIKTKFHMALTRAAPAGLLVGVESSIFLAPDTFVDPDIVLYPAHLSSQDLRGPDLLLVVEVAASSLSYDLGRKAKIYARHGVRDYWAIDANSRVAYVHSGPTPEGWTRVRRLEAQTKLVFPPLPDFSLRLAEL